MKLIARLPHKMPLHSVASSRQVEHEELARLPVCTLVRRAGEALGRLALALAPHARHVWVECGAGNNGADGLHAALWLARAGKRVTVAVPGDEFEQTLEAADAWQHLAAAGVEIFRQALKPTAADRVVTALAATGIAAKAAPAPAPHEETPDVSALPPLDKDDIAIDALLGLGANRAPTGEIADRIRRLNALPCPVLAADVPSGLHADTGEPLGDDVVHAAFTLSLLTLHPGLFTALGRDHAGQVWLDRLEVADAAMPPADAWLTSVGDVREVRSPRSHAQNKGSFGDVAIVGGARGMRGAALLASRSAHASGAGRVYLSPLDPQDQLFDSERPELMFRPEWWLSDPMTLGAATVVCGCGGDHAVADALPPLLAQAGRLVLDADALNAISKSEPLQAQLRERAERGQPTILTPHPLEAARLIGARTAEVQADRLDAARRIALRYACVVVLKGSGTIIASPSHTPFINPTGNSALATAGTGDVLAGWTGGLWAQQPRDGDGAKDDASKARALDTAFKVALAAVWMHGAAAERETVRVLRAGDLIGQLMKVDDDFSKSA